MAGYLLDTCTFIWVAWEASELSDDARGIFHDPSNPIYLSSASTWELAIKHEIGRLDLPQEPQHFVPDMRERHSITSLPIDEESSLRVSTLPTLHRDPFDRMLIAQAISHGLSLLTPDEHIWRYPVKCVW